MKTTQIDPMFGVILIIVLLAIALMIAVTTHNERYWPEGLTPTPVVDTR